MGEIADAFLNGDYCEGCGEYLGEGEGWVRLCADCQSKEDKETKVD